VGRAAGAAGSGDSGAAATSPELPGDTSLELPELSASGVTTSSSPSSSSSPPQNFGPLRVAAYFAGAAWCNGHPLQCLQWAKM
jgi:hypothetical protein